MKEFLAPLSPTMPPLALNCTADMCHHVRKVLGEKHLLSRKDGAIHKAYNPMGCFPVSVHSLERENTQAGRQAEERSGSEKLCKLSPHLCKNQKQNAQGNQEMFSLCLVPAKDSGHL